MRPRGTPTLALTFALVALAALAGAMPALARRAQRPQAHPHVRPRAFASCATLVGYARAHYAFTRGLPEAPVRALSEPTTIAPMSAGPGVRAAPAAGEVSSGSGSSYSTTNNQEPGVDEPDVVKTNGATIFAIEGGTLYAIDVAGTPSTLRLAGKLPLAGSAYGAQLLLRGNRLLVISSASVVPVGILRAAPAVPAPAGAAARVLARARAIVAPGVHAPIEPSPYFDAATTTLTEVDITNPAAMKVARTLTLEGTFVDARQNGSTARLVIASAPRALADGALRARSAGWIPRRRFHSFITGHRSSRLLAGCSAIRRPERFSGLGMLSILTIDLDRGLYTVNSTALMADAQIVYGSQRNLYVATQRWIDPATSVSALPHSQETVIDQFDATDPEHTTLVASGAVPGYLLNQFSLSEAAGFLRVASTSSPIWWEGAGPASSQSFVTVLADRGGALVPVGQVSGLGAGQKIYSVRFIGDTGYVVTFRSVDPLYTIDLSTPSAPRVAGMLELAGYSAYLHPLGSGLLLGVGQAVGPGNEPEGTQLELFDVSRAAAPALLARTPLGVGSSSSVEYEHHAFLFWPPTSLAVLPVSISARVLVPLPLGAVRPAASSAPAQPSVAPEAFVGAIGYHVDRSGITLLGLIEHDPISGSSPPIDRSVVVGGRLFTVSSEGVMASDLGTLARVGFLAFPPPASAGGGSAAAPPAHAGG